MKIERYGRYWAVYDADGELICITVYRKGASEVIRRLTPASTFSDRKERFEPVTDEASRKVSSCI